MQLKAMTPSHCTYVNVKIDKWDLDDSFRDDMCVAVLITVHQPTMQSPRTASEYQANKQEGLLGKSIQWGAEWRN